MDNNKQHEKVNVTDEVLDEIAGGAPIFADVQCSVCHSFVVTCNAVMHNNRMICRECMKKINNA